MAFQIGEFKFSGHLVLAPMAGVTDRVLRNICLAEGASYAVGEMLSAQTHLWDSNKSSTRQANQLDPEPRSIQLLGTEADQLLEAAKIQVEQGAQIIDLNLGCPAKKVCKVSAGSALLADPKKVAEIFKTLTENLPVPVTAKIRTGIDRENKNALEIAQIAEQNGIAALTIHGRTRADKFNGEAEYETIKKVKQAVQIPIIANGDICTPEQAKFVLEYTLSDALMIGRAALGQPWIFKQIQQFINDTTRSGCESLQHKQQVITNHLAGIYQLYGEAHGIRIARKHLGWYAQHLPAGEALRKSFNQAPTLEMQQIIVQQYFEQALAYN